MVEVLSSPWIIAITVVAGIAFVLGVITILSATGVLDLNPTSQPTESPPVPAAPVATEIPDAVVGSTLVLSLGGADDFNVQLVARPPEAERSDMEFKEDGTGSLDIEASYVATDDVRSGRFRFTDTSLAMITVQPPTTVDEEYTLSLPAASPTDNSIMVFQSDGTSTFEPKAEAGNLTGPVTSVGLATSITNSAVTYDKIQNVSASSRLLGSSATGSGAPPSEITLGTGLTMTGSTMSSSNMSANSRLLGSSDTGSGAPPSEITLGTNLSMSGSTLNATAPTTLGLVFPGNGGYNISTADSGKVFILRPSGAQNGAYTLPSTGLTDGLYYHFIRDSGLFGNATINGGTMVIVNSSGTVTSSTSIATGNSTDGGRVTLVYDSGAGEWFSIGPAIVFA